MCVNVTYVNVSWVSNFLNVTHISDEHVLGFCRAELDHSVHHVLLERCISIRLQEHGAQVRDVLRRQRRDGIHQQRSTRCAARRACKCVCFGGCDCVELDCEVLHLV